MTDKRACPDCGADISIRARKCICGWVKAFTPGAQAGDTQALRCAWLVNAERCRYAGSCSTSTLGGGPNYCFGHLVCAQTGDGALGAKIVDESIEKVPDGVDYTATGIVAAARKRLRERAESSTAPSFPRFQPDGLALKPKQSTIGAVAGAHWLDRKEQLDEARAERLAMQSEGQQV